MALHIQALMLIQVGRLERAAWVLEASISVRDPHQLYAPVVRPLWALTFARLGQRQRGWEVLRDAFATGVPPIFFEGACYWAAWFLFEVGHAREAAVLLGFFEASAGGNGSREVNDLKDSPAKLRSALDGALGAALQEAVAVGRSWTLPDALRMLRDLA
ncbi:hypothetical protein DES52_11820 [Deinococcus yavapaiensis KR-236]|uniref:Tetratricopeptide repeat protein n=2 Tax=Deinococcus TaxID=1298 RepID=A0A318S4J7_9DEIO|nr:hypothetical protein DES52_11820 [Deinococcus yavapaiensis KR-236]